MDKSGAGVSDRLHGARPCREAQAFSVYLDLWALRCDSLQTPAGIANPGNNTSNKNEGTGRWPNQH